MCGPDLLERAIAPVKTGELTAIWCCRHPFRVVAFGWFEIPAYMRGNVCGDPKECDWVKEVESGWATLPTREETTGSRCLRERGFCLQTRKNTTHEGESSVWVQQNCREGQKYTTVRRAIWNAYFNMVTNFGWTNCDGSATRWSVTSDMEASSSRPELLWCDM